MYRQVFTPTEADSELPPFTVPREWFGRQVEFIVFPVDFSVNGTQKKPKDDIMQYFGAWKSDKTAEEIIADIYDSRSSNRTRVLAEL
jgi:hypothetical protein